MVASPKVIFHPSVIEYLDQLGKSLFDAGYFGFHEKRRPLPYPLYHQQPSGRAIY
jgi:hypothetical protein